VLATAAAKKAHDDLAASKKANGEYKEPKKVHYLEVLYRMA
jgi:hypothetical protein